MVLDQLGNLAKGIATLAIVLVVTFLIMAQGKSQMTVNSTGYNATHELQNAVDDIPGWVPLIVIATIGGILLGLVAMFKKR